MYPHPDIPSPPLIRVSQLRSALRPALGSGSPMDMFSSARSSRALIRSYWSACACPVRPASRRASALPPPPSPQPRRGTHRIGPVIETADGEVCREAERERDNEGDEGVPAPVGEVKVALQLIERALRLGHVRQEALPEVGQERLRIDCGGKCNAADALSGRNGDIPLTQEGTHLIGRSKAPRSSLGRGELGGSVPQMLATVVRTEPSTGAASRRKTSSGAPHPRRSRALHRGNECG